MAIDLRHSCKNLGKTKSDFVCSSFPASILEKSGFIHGKGQLGREIMEMGIRIGVGGDSVG